MGQIMLTDEMPGEVHDGLAFNPDAARLTADFDVLMCYQIFLGRDPETSFVIQDSKAHRLPKVVTGFLRSREFADSVIHAVEAGRPLIHDVTSFAPTRQQVGWLLRTLRVNDGAALREARSWRELFIALFDVPGLRTHAGSGAPATAAEPRHDPMRSEQSRSELARPESPWPEPVPARKPSELDELDQRLACIEGELRHLGAVLRGLASKLEVLTPPNRSRLPG